MNKPGIPPVPRGLEPELARFLRVLKERHEIVGGERASRVAPLQVDATLDDVIAKINELIGVLQ